MDKQNAIEVRNVNKDFKIEYDKAKTLKERLLFLGRGNAEYHHVLKNININIKKGETVGLIGTNGSGKSTLLKLMTKIIFPNQGTIETNGKITSLLELGAGFHDDFTGRENIYFNASIFGLTHKQIDERIEDIIEFSELGSFIDNPIRTYSSGMYMRLAFSVAINVDADILLIDEILAVGDQYFQEKCYAKLNELKKKGKTIVFVSHSLDVVNSLCTRAIWIYNGEVHEDGNPEEVIEHYLDQLALDHSAERKMALEAGAVGQAMTYIDEPKNYQEFPSSLRYTDSHGWIISDDPSARLRILLDDKELDPDVTRYKRLDVYKAFHADYAGLVDIDTLGWKFNLSLEDLELGTHYMKVQCVNKNEEVLSETKMEFDIK